MKEKPKGMNGRRGRGDDNGRDPRIILVIPKMRANQVMEGRGHSIRWFTGCALIKCMYFRKAA